MQKKRNNTYTIEREFLNKKSCKCTIEKVLEIYIDLALNQVFNAHTAIGKDD